MALLQVLALELVLLQSLVVVADIDLLVADIAGWDYILVVGIACLENLVAVDIDDLDFLAEGIAGYDFLVGEMDDSLVEDIAGDYVRAVAVVG